MILVTGGAGFIGSNFILDSLLPKTGLETPISSKESAAQNKKPGIVNLDKLTYAGNPSNLKELDGCPNYLFVQGDIADRKLVSALLSKHQVSAIVHFAAESHVDRSIHGPMEFIETNVVGTFQLLEAARAYFETLSSTEQDRFRFLHVSTDEVYGSLKPSEPAFLETRQYEPNSPYSASKAASDHLVRAWHHTYGFPVLTTNCSNNYGPFHFPEKLIPLVILNAIAGKPLPIYGDGQQIRDWLYVRDHCAAIRCVLEKGRLGQTYNIGGRNEKTNLEVVQTICAILDELRPKSGGSYTDQITFVKDRPGHDRRYAIDASKIEHELGWSPSETFETGIRKTVQWYLENTLWVDGVQSGSYRAWIDKQYAK